MFFLKAFIIHYIGYFAYHHPVLPYQSKYQKLFVKELPDSQCESNTFKKIICECMSS